ncbi:MAG: hypothetical protein ACLR23_18365 [Clostridia bacterium]
MKNLKKIAIMLIIAAMSLSTAACSKQGDSSSGSSTGDSGSESSTDTSGSESSVSTSGTVERKEGFPLSDEKVELEIWTIRSTQVEDLETNKAYPVV